MSPLTKTRPGYDSVSDFDINEWADEGTPITDLGTLFVKMGRVSRLVEHLIPTVHTLSARQAEMGNTIKELTQQQSKDQATGMKVDMLCKEIEKKDKTKFATRLATGTLIVSVLLASLGSAGGGIWYIRGLQGNLELEVQARQDRDKVIDATLKNLPTRDQLAQQLPTRYDVQSLTKTIRDEQHDTTLLREMFAGLDRRARSRWCRSKRRDLPVDLCQ